MTEARQEEEEGRGSVPLASLGASQVTLHGADVPKCHQWLGKMREKHPQTALPSPCKFPICSRLPQGAGPFDGGCEQAQASPGLRPSTYHEGAVRSSACDTAGRWRDCTGRGWEKTDSSQVQAGDEMGLQLGKKSEEEEVSPT